MYNVYIFIDIHVWLIILYGMDFLLGIHHVARIRRIRCHMGFPPPPWISFPRIKYHMVKVPHLWDFSPPPPLPKQIAHAVLILLHMEFVLEEICHRGGSSAMGFLPGGGGLPYGIIPPWGSSAMGFLPGGEACHMVLFPPGEVLLWDFFRGKVCHMMFLHGERLPYGIISAGTISHGICSLIMKFVGGGGDLP